MNITKIDVKAGDKIVISTDAKYLHVEGFGTYKRVNINFFESTKVEIKQNAKNEIVIE